MQIRMQSSTSCKTMTYTDFRLPTSFFWNLIIPSIKWGGWFAFTTKVPRDFILQQMPPDYYICVCLYCSYNYLNPIFLFVVFFLYLLIFLTLLKKKEANIWLLKSNIFFVFYYFSTFLISNRNTWIVLLIFNFSEYNVS